MANSMVAEEIALENKEKMLEGTLNSHEVRKKDGCVQMDTPKNNVRDRSTNTREQVAKMSGVGTGVVACFLKKNPPVYNFRRDFLSKIY